MSAEPLGAPGHRCFRRAAVARVAATVLLVGQWSALAALLVIDRWWCAAAFLVAAAARIGCLAAAREFAGAGASAVRTEIARRVLDRDLGARGSAAPDDPAALAQRVLELADRIAGYHAAAAPVRASVPASCGVVLAACAVVHWPVAVLLAASTPIVLVNMWVVGLATKAAADRQLDAVRALSARLHDRFRGLAVLRMLGAVDREEAAVTDAGRELNRATMTVLRRAMLSGAVIDAVVTIGVALTATYCGFALLGYVHVPGSPVLTYGPALAVLLLTPAYFAPLRDLGSAYHLREEANAAADALGETADSATSSKRIVGGIVGAPEVTLDAVTVRRGDATIVDRFDARVTAGTVVLIRGRSGAGKSTLLATIAGLLPPTSGSVRIDGAPPQVGSASWIGQSTVLLPATIADNIRLGRPDATIDDVAAAAATAGLGPLLADTGLDTVIGPGARPVSAGEAQRIALARALIRDAGLWLLDEPTAHLDAAAEAALIATLEVAAAGRTVLIATHSPALVALADDQWDLAGIPVGVAP